ncbi:MAG: hypothetical protein ACTSQY_06825 [Candidatus Odinarchaeia archaeon]
MKFSDLDFIEKILIYEENIEINLTRILILLNIFSQSDSQEVFRGLTKLVKLDFLLRYPLNLERAVNHDRKRKIDCHIKEHEKYNVETKMIRYLYGPWDPKYRNYLNILIAKNLIKIKKIRKTYVINLTENGLKISNTLLKLPELEDYKNRSMILYNKFKDYNSTKIKNYIYKIFPEITTLDIGDEIQYEHKTEDPYITL